MANAIIDKYKKMAANPLTKAASKKGGADDRTGSVSFGKSVKKPIAKIAKATTPKKTPMKKGPGFEAARKKMYGLK